MCVLWERIDEKREEGREKREREKLKLELL